MKISALRLFNVKRFAGRGVAIEGIGEGVNVLCAANEFGKSTSFEALHALFFQPHSSTAGDVRNLRPYSGGNPIIEADISTDEGHYRLTKQYYGSKFARVADITTGRLLAQADEAENFISNLIRGGAGGPAGLLWVRQGITGIEKRSRTEEESDKQVRAGLLESVQGEVEAVTGGRRMADIMAATAEAGSILVTATGRPKTGGRFAAAIDLRDRLASEEQRLSGEVASLRDALDDRSKASRRLAELEIADEREARRNAVEVAQAKFDTARAQSDRLKAAEAEHNLALERRDGADLSWKTYQEALGQAQSVLDDTQKATQHREEAVNRRRNAVEQIEKAQREAETAEADGQAAREALDLLDAAAQAQTAADKRLELQQRLDQAENARRAIEDSEAQLAQARLPADAIDELAELDIMIARIRAVQQAARPSIIVAYQDEAAGRVTLSGEALNHGEERGYDGHAQLVAPSVGTITLRSNRPEQDDGRLEQAEESRRTLLASMGVSDLAAARAQQVVAHELQARANESRAQLAVLAPDGLAKLQADVAEHASVDPAPIELKADPAETRTVLNEAERRRKQAGQTARSIEPVRVSADEAFVRAETELAKLQAQTQQVDAILGPVEQRALRGQELTDRLADLAQALSEAEAIVTEQRDAAVSLEAAEAALTRVLSVEQAAEMETQQLRENIAGLNAQIRTRSDEAIEEKWRETAEALDAATIRAAAFEKEVAVLLRLTIALETARSEARELYLKPVMTELQPLLGLLFDDISIVFDEKTLLPQTILRNGQEEEVDRLSGGMREQLSVLTRLAFARLLARNGRPAPVILDDALVYSDDDRIERMFDALHRQSRDQQIIVFSCRQRAFQKLGGNILQMTEWQP